MRCHVADVSLFPIRDILKYLQGSDIIEGRSQLLPLPVDVGGDHMTRYPEIFHSLQVIGSLKALSEAHAELLPHLNALRNS